MFGWDYRRPDRNDDANTDRVQSQEDQRWAQDGNDELEFADLCAFKDLNN